MSRYSCPELGLGEGLAPALPAPPGAADKSWALPISLGFYLWVLTGVENRDGESLAPHPQLLHNSWLGKPWVPPSGPYLAIGAFLEEF